MFVKEEVFVFVEELFLNVGREERYVLSEAGGADEQVAGEDRAVFEDSDCLAVVLSLVSLAIS